MLARLSQYKPDTLTCTMLQGSRRHDVVLFVLLFLSLNIHLFSEIIKLNDPSVFSSGAMFESVSRRLLSKL